MSFGSRSSSPIISLQPVLEKNRIRQEQDLSSIHSRLEQLANLGKPALRPPVPEPFPESESSGFLPYTPKRVPIPSYDPIEKRNQRMKENNTPIPEPKPQEFIPSTSPNTPGGPSLPAGKDQVKEIINLYANNYGVDPRIAMGIANIESSLNPQAKAKTSSASGLYQIIDSTWKQYGGGDRMNPYDNTNAAMKLIKSNQDYLSQRGIAPTPGATYLAHFLGAGSAAKVLSNPSAPISKYVSSEAMKANNLKDMPGNDLLSWATRKMNYTDAAPAVASNTKGGT